MQELKSTHYVVAFLTLAALLLWTNLLLVAQNHRIAEQVSALERQVELQERASLSVHMTQTLGLSRVLYGFVKAGGDFLKAPQDEKSKQGLSAAFTALEGQNGIDQTVLTALSRCRVTKHIREAREVVDNEERFAELSYARHMYTLGQLLPGVEPEVLKNVVKEADLSPTILIASEELRTLHLAFQRAGDRALQDQGWVAQLRRSLMQSLGFAAACRVESERLFEASQS